MDIIGKTVKVNGCRPHDTCIKCSNACGRAIDGIVTVHVLSVYTRNSEYEYYGKAQDSNTFYFCASNVIINKKSIHIEKVKNGARENAKV